MFTDWIAIRAGGSFSRSELDDLRWLAGMYDAVEGRLVGRTCTTDPNPWPKSPVYTEYTRVTDRQTDRQTEMRSQ